jgi:hypothetical protein
LPDTYNYLPTSSIAGAAVLGVLCIIVIAKT